MALSFFYLAFVRLLQLVRLSCRGQQELAVEVVMLRHEVAVLRRQVVRPALQPADRAVLAGLSRLLSAARRGRFFVQPETLLKPKSSTSTGPPIVGGPLDNHERGKRTPSKGSVVRC